MNEISKQAGLRETTINGKRYTIQLLPASLGLGLGNKLIKTFATAVGVMLDEANKEFEFEESSVFTDIAIAISSKLDDMDVVNSTMLLMKDAYADGKLLDFDEHFKGKYGDMIALLEFCLRENYGDFFTSYLKAKGLEIHTLRDLIPKERTPQESGN